VGTVLADDPLLTARPDPGHQPLRVVVDSRGRTPLTARTLSGPRPAVVAVRSDVDDGAYPDQLPLPGDDDGRVDLRALLEALDGRGVVSVLLEGGPTLAGAFVREGLVDRVVGYVAPALLGDGPPALAAAGVGTIAQAHRLRLDDVTRTGDDVRLTMRREG
jgi:diaminohydroxyphosphoribosylaminopyrimidine deaminase/5-amino-6-(5-phosphoribosylamino)uracil reductase